MLRLKQFFTISLGVIIVDIIYNFMWKQRDIFEPPLYKFIEFFLFYVIGILISYGLIYLREILMEGNK